MPHLLGAKPVSEMTDEEAFLRMWELTARPGNSTKEMTRLLPKAQRFINTIPRRD